ncbi:hypothetical protein POMI540_3875 [Schizosaccharomyces pombe]|uniref:Meiotically up-regulated gene 123 protein n=1 Tax=Schizosaccharomyces pombe (strain 972 / ATCC 24843) TaxID=284812 RepID=MU123_SCHPO|nr:protein mug123 [Schizosaccharomyces pombe]O74461.1 RecName: Full=Meiotically up-regulated gene 123 protein [Schizosaccharomyces pombe 972h-]CAA20755.1 meiotically upregulated gene Mug123 [Schizosaccharomyces pombe]|eukprot:NP_587927.1 protein mug123 [Schizosaccharomyces pombe]
MERLATRSSHDDPYSRSSLPTSNAINSNHESNGSTFSYVQSLRRAKATVWSDIGRVAPLHSSPSIKSSSQNGKSSSKGLGGMRSRVFSSQHHGVYHTRPASLHSRTMAPQHTILTPRLSATEGKDDDEDELVISTSNTAPTYISMIESSRASSTHSGTAPSIMGMSIHSRADSRAETTQSDGFESRSGSPTHDIQSYLVNRRSSSSESSDEDSAEEGMKRLVITNMGDNDEFDSD